MLFCLFPTIYASVTADKTFTHMSGKTQTKCCFIVPVLLQIPSFFQMRLSILHLYALQQQSNAASEARHLLNGAYDDLRMCHENERHKCQNGQKNHENFQNRMLFTLCYAH